MLQRLSMKGLFPTLIFLLPWVVNAQKLCSDSFELELDFEEAYTFPKQAMTALHDADDDYLYVASMAQGLAIYEIEEGEGLKHITDVPVSSLGNLDVMSLSQNGDYLYLALGNSFNDKQNPGLAIVDVSDPTKPSVKDVWKHSVATSGAGIVKIQGDYAYLGAMGHGLFVLDISDKSAIKEVSQLVPSINYPNPDKPDPLKFNARGMAVDGDLVYLCYDAGGLRIINVADKENPRQTGKYSLPELNKLPRAYNNIIYRDGLVYIAIDYCGLEVLDVRDTANIKQVSWLNPWDCTKSTLEWFKSKGHTNEMALIDECNALGVSTGKSEMMLFDISDPEKPMLCDSFGMVLNDEGTWGISVYEQTFYLSYIFVPLGIPFKSNWAGIRAVKLEGHCGQTGISTVKPALAFEVFTGNGFIEIETTSMDAQFVSIRSMDGRLLAQHNIKGRFRVESLPAGFYLIASGSGVKKVVVY